VKIEDRCRNVQGFQEFNIDLDAWRAPKPHGISGLFRLKNEADFMVMAIESHLPFLDEAVLLIQESADNTEALAAQMREKHGSEKIRIFKYPFSVHWIGTPEHFSLPENDLHTMMHLTNYGISKCRFSWVAKIEGDVIALRTFSRLREWIDAEPAATKYYGRVGLNVAGPGGRQFPVEAPRNAGWDEAIFNNHPIWHCIRNQKWESINFHDKRDKLENNGWDFLHVKRCKPIHQRLSESETWMPLVKGHLLHALAKYEGRHPFPGFGDFCPDILFERVL